MSATLSVVQLRNILQLPERPFEDVYAYDGTSYYDLTQREPCSIFGLSGTVSSTAHNFVLGTDYQLTAGSIDWTVGTKRPDFGTAFTIDYTYSRLGSDAASTAVANAEMIVSQDLGQAFPYGASTTSGIAFNNLATMGASFVAAREACYTLAVSDIDISQKARRGSVLVDDSKKTADWASAAQTWQSRYKRYLTMIRPGGMVRAFTVVNRNYYSLLFGPAEAIAFDGVLDLPYAGFPDSGVF